MLYEFEALQQYVERQPAVIFEELAEEEGLERLLEAGVPAKILSPFVKQSAQTHLETLSAREKGTGDSRSAADLRFVQIVEGRLEFK